MMQAKKDFDASIDEVEFLNRTAQEVGPEGDTKIYYKVIILLLCAKIETFVKDSTKEYIDFLLDLNLSKKDIPEKFLIEIIRNEIQKISDVGLEKYIRNQRFVERSKVFSLIWDSKYSLTKLEKEDFTVSISNNGTTAFEDSYKKIGFPNIIKEMEDFKTEEGIFGMVSTLTSYSIPNTINKIVRMRNEIIHEDATPSITENDVDLFINISKDFISKVDHVLAASMDNIKGKLGE